MWIMKDFMPNKIEAIKIENLLYNIQLLYFYSNFLILTTSSYLITKIKQFSITILDSHTTYYLL